MPAPTPTASNEHLCQRRKCHSQAFPVRRTVRRSRKNNNREHRIDTEESSMPNRTSRLQSIGSRASLYTRDHTRRSSMGTHRNSRDFPGNPRSRNSKMEPGEDIIIS